MTETQSIAYATEGEHESGESGELAAMALQAEAEMSIEDPGPACNDEERLVNKFIRRRNHIEAEIARVKEYTKALIAQLESRLKGLDYVYIPVVEPIVRKMLEGSKKKSITTPFGKAGYRTSGGRLFVADEVQLMALADTNDQLRPAIVVKRSIPFAAVNDYFKTTGEIPAGCDVSPVVEKFYVG